MAKTILVALKVENKIDLLLRHLEKVVKRGDRIVFLVAYRQDIPSCLLAQISLLQTGFENGVAWEQRRARLMGRAKNPRGGRCRQTRAPSV